jgi:hypothetical protein
MTQKTERRRLAILHALPSLRSTLYGSSIPVTHLVNDVRCRYVYVFYMYVNICCMRELLCVGSICLVFTLVYFRHIHDDYRTYKQYHGTRTVRPCTIVPK